MEKKSRTGDSVFLKLPRMFLIMKTVFISLVCTLNVQANVFSQHTKFDIAMKNVTVSEVLCYLEEISKYRFVYDSDAIDRMQRVDVEMKGTKLETVLESIFVKSGFSFVIEDGVVIIREAGKKQITAGILPQSRKITGRVRDHGGHPLPGVTVVLKGTSVGVVTDVDGHFKMDLPADHETVLVFSFVGMKTQEVYYKGEKELNVVMEEEVKQMDEVVVTGIFSKSKESYTGAVSVITEKELKSFGNRNILTTLRNIDPSFNILESNEWGSNPNRLPEVQIRGAANMPDIDQLQSDTKAELNTPLIIMDGFEITLERMMDLDDSEVETITLLKDASATAIYGSRGANGVIVITTKEPEPGKLRFAYTGSLNLEVPDLSDYDVLNAREKLDMELRSGYYDSVRAEYEVQLKQKYNEILQQVERGVNTYWLSKPLRVGVGHRHNIKLEGGDPSFRYSATVQYNDVAGVMKESFRRTFNGGINLSYKTSDLIFRNQLTIGLNKAQESPYGTFDQYVKLNPYWTATDENGNVKRFFDEDYSYWGGNNPANPLYNATLNNFNRGKSTLFRNNFIIEWSIYNNLKLRGRIGITKSNSESEIFLSPEHTQFEETDKLEKGSYQNTHMDDFSYESDFTVRYGCLLKEVHQLNVVGGTYIYAQEGNRKGFSAVGFPVGNYVTPSFANAYTPNSKPTYVGSIRRSASFYLNGGYAYNNRYLLDFNIRSDGSSVFGSNKRYTTTWAVGLAWNLYNEKFMAGASQLIDMLRFRASIGNPGNQNFGSFQTFTTYRFDNWLMNGFGTGVIIEGYGNPDLKWQKTLDKNIGMDLSMFGNRFHVTLDLYHKNTDPLLAVIGIPSSVGTSQMLTNIGRQVEKGINGTIKYSPLYRPEERKNYTISVNFRTSKAEYAHIGNKLDQFNTENKSTNSTSLARYYDGGSPTALWSVRSAGIDPSSGKEVFVKKDGTYTFQYDYDEEVVVGNSRPKIEGVIGNTLYYKGFSCSLQLRYSLGGDVFNNALYSKVENISSEGLKSNQDKRALSRRWVNPGDIAKYKDISLTEYTPISSRFVQKNNYLSIESVRLGYEFGPELVRRIGMSQLSLNAYMNDIARFSSIKSERGIDYPFARTLSVSISATF